MAAAAAAPAAIELAGQSEGATPWADASHQGRSSASRGTPPLLGTPLLSQLALGAAEWGCSTGSGKLELAAARLREAPTAPRFVGPALTSAPAPAEGRGRRAEAEIDEGPFVNKQNEQPASQPAN